MSKYWLLLLLLLPLGVNAQKADFGSSTASSTIEIKVEDLPPELSPLYELKAVPTDIIVPEKEGENIALRQANTEVYEQADGSKEYKIYSAPVYAVDQDGFFTKELDYLYQLKPTAIRAKTWKETAFNYLFKIPLAYAQTTYYGKNDDSIYSSNNVWATARGVTSGTTVGNPSLVYARLYAASGSNYSIARGFLNFDTSAIDDSYEVSSSTLYIYGESKFGTQSRTYNVYSSTASDPVAGGDFDLTDDTNYSDTGISQSSFSTSGYNSWLFNADGRNAISLTGVTKIAIREADKDVADVAPVSDENVGIRYYEVEETGTSKDPYLSILAEEVISEGTTTTATSCDMTAGTLDDDTISTYLLYWYYVILMFVILTIGYSLIDRIFHLFKGKR